MSEFRSELRVSLLDPYHRDGTGLWMLLIELVYYSALLKREVRVPVGFVTDFATVPILPLVYAFAGNRYHMAAVVHDYLCRMRRIKRDKADLVFLEAMRVLNAMEIAHMKEAGVDDDEILERKAALEGRATLMYAGVAAYTKSGLWKTDVDKPGFQPVA